MTATIIQFNKHGLCIHDHLRIDESSNEVICVDCKKNVNPIWVLKRLSMQESTLQNKLRDLDKQVTRKENQLLKLTSAIKKQKKQ